jgi:hypothetical protein
MRCVIVIFYTVQVKTYWENKIIGEKSTKFLSLLLIYLLKSFLPSFLSIFLAPICFFKIAKIIFKSRGETVKLVRGLRIWFACL